MPQTTRGIRASTMAPAHIGQGSLVTYRMLSVNRQSPAALAACVIARISAWAVGSFSVRV